MAIDMNRTTIALPGQVSSEIWQKTQGSSAVMGLARRIALPGLGVTIPVITGDPEAAWVGETDKKPVKRGTLATKQMTPYTLAVIVPFSNQFRRDLPGLYDALVQRLPNALGKKFDQTVFGGVTAPGSNFDTLKGCTAQEIGTDAYKGLVAADADVAAHDGILSGWVLSPQGKAVLLNAVDGNKRPLFINSVAEGAVPMILGARASYSKGAYVADSTSAKKNVVGFGGDWTQAVYGTVEGVQITISDQATLEDGGTTINLFQQNMFAVRAEIEVGFRCDTTVFNKLTVTGT
ncbi:phage major capsid protein [Gemmiger sp.]|uniref:phage major capsid protein n=1 Tax=Gemmiger sp. TaxID=2049027 RepID=UPI002A91D1A4|nr:phage major capsid protein [Gemmiger sp.]MDY5604394.1 phage major capsid protein [Gemmiger sp.]